ncbi:MAG TPA: recombinase family protein [Gemmatimonadales bacterium]
MTKPKAAAIYARISSDRQDDALGVTRQLEDCRALAERKGWTVAEEYVDNDVSAWDPRKTRTRYQAMLADLKAGERDAILVYDLYRLIRQPRELEQFFEICDTASVRNLASVTGDIDLGTEDGRFMARILGAVASKESDTRSRRIRRKHQELAERGLSHGGGHRPFGYTDDRRHVNPEEAAIIREFAPRLLAGETLRSLALDLERRGITTSRGGKWRPTTLRLVLSSARISGQREHHGQIIATAEWPAIITPEQTTRIRALLADPSRRARRAPRRYLLSGGLIHCQRCDLPMIARPRQNGQRRYFCVAGPGLGGCNRMAINAEHVETWTVAAVIQRLDSPEFAASLRGHATDADATVQRELETAQTQLDELAAAYGAQQISLREWMTARSPIEARFQTARRRLSRLVGTAALDGFPGSDALKDAWPTLPIDRQQAILRAVIHHVTVAPAVQPYTRFNPDRLSITWRA